MIFAEHIPAELLDADLQYGAFALSALVIAILGVVVWKLLKIIGNHLSHIQRALNDLKQDIAGLPCERDRVCPGEEN